MANSLRMLEGYRVLDFTQYVAGPTCSRLMAEFGAEVVKLELAPGGDRVRDWGLSPALRRRAATAPITCSTIIAS